MFIWVLTFPPSEGNIEKLHVYYFTKSPSSRRPIIKPKIVLRKQRMYFAMDRCKSRQCQQTNSNDSTPSACENRLSPLAQRNVQAMEIWKNLLDPPNGCLHNGFTKSNRAGFVPGTCPCTSLILRGPQHPFSLYFASTKGLWLARAPEICECSPCSLVFDRSVSPVF